MNTMKRGFTLIEVMVSMFIVASLTAASYPYVIKKVQQSKAKKISLVVDDVARGAQNYYAEQDPKTWPGGDVCADAIEVLIDEGYMPAILDKTTGVYAGTRIIETECNTDKRIFNISVSTIGGAASLTNYQKTVNDMVRISRDWTSDSILTASDIEADESKFYSAIPRPEAAVGLSVITEDIIGEADGTTADSLWNAIRNGNLQEGGIDFDIKNASATTINGIEIHDAGGAGLSNVAIGKDNLNSNTTGRNNTVLGVDAGYNNSSGSNNVFIGNKAGYSEIGSNKLYISSTDTADPLIYGEFDTQEVKVNGNIEITGSIKVTGDLPPDGGAGAGITAGAEGAYPVGSIYMNASNNENPATIFGFGTWSSFGAGRVLVGLDTGQDEFNSVGQTGGAKTHTLTEDEMPSHSHTLTTYIDSGGNHGQPLLGKNGPSTNSGPIGSAGGDDPHNNLQPYITVYMWLRTD